jgi:cellulose biosynthesis protein BcsQ
MGHVITFAQQKGGAGKTTVLLTMDEINVVQDADGRNFVMTDLTPDGLQGRPEYVAPEG